LPSGVILTYAQEEEREVKGLKVSVLPVWKWLLIDFDIKEPSAKYGRSKRKKLK
jgi:hypothetical protein